MTAAYPSTVSASTNAANTTLSTTLFVFSVIGAMIAIIVIVAMWRVFTKAGRPGWASIVPFYNAYVLLKIVGRPGWWLVLLFLPGVNVVISLIVAIDLARAFGRGTVFGVIGLFLFGPVGYVILGFGNARYLGPDGELSDDDRPPVREPQYLLLGGIALVVVAALAAIWFGVAWLLAANDSSLGRATARDDVDRIGRQAIKTFHTLDYHHVDEGLDNWQNASTGALRDEVVGRRETSKQAIAEAKTVTEATVLSLAVTELNEFEGKATVIAAVRVKVTPEGKPSEDKYMRIQGVLERVGDDWKLSGIGQVDFARS